MTLNTNNAKDLNRRIKLHGVPKYLLKLEPEALKALLEMYSIWAPIEVVADWKKDYQK